MPTFGSSPEFFSLVYARHSGDLILTTLLFSKVKSPSAKYLSPKVSQMTDT